MLDTVSAFLNIEVNANCPNCKSLINIMEKEETCDYDHNAEGEIVSQACPDDESWIEAHEKFEIKHITCGICGEGFNIKGLLW